MDFSGFWNQILLNASTAVCVRANPSLIQGLQVINSASYVTSSDTNSSICSDETSSNNNQLQDEQEDDVNDGHFENDVHQEQSEFEEENQKKRSIQRTRYSKEEYRCTQCPYTCTTEKAFLKHLRWCESSNKTSARNPLLSCPICGKDRRDEETLSVHMMKHKQDKHFCCDICKFKSLQLKKLIQHRRMHTGEKPHLCPFCSYRSSRRDNLRSHVRRVHKKHDLPCDTFTPRSMILSPRKST